MNSDIKQLAKENKVKLWQVAQIIGVSDSNFSRMLRYDIKPQLRNEILDTILMLANRTI